MHFSWKHKRYAKQNSVIKKRQDLNPAHIKNVNRLLQRLHACRQEVNNSDRCHSPYTP